MQNRGYIDERYSRPRHVNTGRLPCCVPFCPRTTAAPDDGRWFMCRPHWGHVNPTIRKLINRNSSTPERLFRIAVRQALEGSHWDPRC